VKNEKQKSILKKEKRILLLGIGSTENPIKPVNENCHRPLLTKYSTIPVQATRKFSTGDKHAIKSALHTLKEDYLKSAFVLNAMSNPYLKKDELRLLLYFYTQLFNSSGLFSTISQFKESGERVKFDYSANYGREGWLEAGKEGTMRYENFLLEEETIYVLDRMQDFQCNFTSSTIVTSIKRLHDFGYITVTEINLANTYEGRKVHNRTGTRARLRHIRLSEELQKKDISNRWIKPTKSTKLKN